MKMWDELFARLKRLEHELEVASQQAQVRTADVAKRMAKGRADLKPETFDGHDDEGDR
jgi:hypothetical protein